MRKLWYVGALMSMLLFLSTSGVTLAQDAAINCQPNTGGLFAGTELTIFKYYRTQGFAAGDGFNHEVAPRVTLGYEGQGGLGTRLRWWQFDQSAAAGRVRTYNIDSEIYQRFALGCCTSLELSAGGRYNSFVDTIGGDDSFHGFGGILGAQIDRQIRRGTLYARYRTSMMFDDARLNGTLLENTNRSQTELAFGWQGSWFTRGGSIATINTGYEWQNWRNYEPYDFGNALQTGNDVGFAGIVVGLGLNF